MGYHRTMSRSTDLIPGSRRGAAEFTPTRWSLVVAAKGEDTAAHQALSILCESYWYPLYAYARRQRHDSADAEDLVQGFFARLLEKRDIAAADPVRGKFRAFLLTAFKHYMANARKAANADKRGGGQPHVSIDFDGADQRFGMEPADTHTPERAFARNWARAMLDQSLDRVRDDYQARGRGRLLEELEPYLGGEEPPYTQTAEALGMTEGAVRVAVHRLRRAFREALRLEVAQTVEDPQDVDGELGNLMEALAP